MGSRMWNEMEYFVEKLAKTGVTHIQMKSWYISFATARQFLMEDDRKKAAVVSFCDRFKPVVSFQQP